MWTLHIPFYVWCTFVVLLALITIAGISPLLWDVVAHINNAMKCMANLTRC